MGKKKIFVLDTNIFIHNPNCLEKFEDNEIIIPYVVIEELDGLKNVQGEVGYNARETMRELAKLREKGNIVQGVNLENGGKVSVYVTKEEDMVEKIFGEEIKMPSGWKKDKADNQILYTVMQIISEATYIMNAYNQAESRVILEDEDYNSGVANDNKRISQRLAILEDNRYKVNNFSSEINKLITDDGSGNINNMQTITDASDIIIVAGNINADINNYA